MTIATLGRGEAASIEAVAEARFVARRAPTFEAAEEIIATSAAEGAATPFQTREWLAGWYRTFAATPGVEPAVISILDAASGRLAAVLPLALAERRGARVIAFADEQVSDYNAPILGAAAPSTEAGARAFWRAAALAFPAADAVELRKMPALVEGRVNPLVLLPGARTSAIVGHALRMPEDFDAWHFGLDRRVRKEFERSWRVFARAPSARLERPREPAAALALLAALERQQAERMAEIGEPYFLDRPTPTSFYRAFLREGVATGEAVITALVAGEEVVAALLGVRRGEAYVMVRISNAGHEWSNCSPGRLVIHETMRLLHGEGVRHVDFSIGRYAYKRRFGAVGEPLFELIRATTPRGLLVQGRADAAHLLRRAPALDRLARRALGLPIHAPDREMDRKRED